MSNLERAEAAGLQLFGLGAHRFGHDRSGLQGLVLGYSRAPDHAFAHALDRLGDVLAQTTGGPTSSVHEPTEDVSRARGELR